ncbi:ribonuclease P protein component 1 [Halococcus salifodinae]|uniref:Ribonuclease P protein component 1 n=2 Tax=Halococcus TaxID=2249 RepID=M0MU44_9EURY|nr:ribonuclease P protein component 1 [Halococcus salifodinae DSM 8989]
MALTPATLARHELCGLHTRVAAADNATLTGIEGRVVRETKNTLSVETAATAGGATAAKQVPKAGATFEFALGGESVAPADVTPADPEAAETVHVTVEGERLVATPARRTERSSDSTWR